MYLFIIHSLGWHVLILKLQVIVKALPRKCMENTARGECCVQHEVKPTAVFMTHPECCVFIHTGIGGALNGILYLTTVN